MSGEHDEFPTIELLPVNRDAADAMAYALEGLRRQINDVFAIPWPPVAELSDLPPEGEPVILGIDAGRDPISIAWVRLPVRR